MDPWNRLFLTSDCLPEKYLLKRDPDESNTRENESSLGHCCLDLERGPTKLFSDRQKREECHSCKVAKSKHVYLYTWLLKGSLHVFIYATGHPNNRALKAWITHHGFSLKNNDPEKL